MSGAGRAAVDASADTDAAERLRSAAFVRLVAHADGDALAAAGLLAGALEESGVPFRARLVRTVADARRATRADEDDALDVAVGVPAPEGGVAVRAGEPPASERAYDLAAALGGDPDPVLALAGVAAAGWPPPAARVPHAAAEERGLVERRPGVAVPTADVADGLAHTTLALCGFSGDPDAVGRALAGSAAPDDRRAVASLVALSASGGDAPARSATAVERALRPLATPAGPFASVGGYGDVLAALSRAAPGLGLAVALGDDRADAALAAWREHARATHEGVAAAETEREGDVAAARVGGAPPWPAARLLRDFRTTAPVAAAVGERAVAVAWVAAGGGEAAAGADADAEDSNATDADVADAVLAAAEESGADAAAVGRRAFVRTDDPESLLATLRGVV